MTKYDYKYAFFILISLRNNLVVPFSTSFTEAVA